MPLTAWVFMGGGLNGPASSAQAVRVHGMGSRPSIYTGESIGAYLAYLTALSGPQEVDSMWEGLTKPDFFNGGSWARKAAILLNLRRGLYDCTPGLETLRRFAAGRRIPPGVQVIITAATSSGVFCGRKF